MADVTDAAGENCHVYIVRKEHQADWLAKAQSGDETAKLCMWAASNYMKDIPRGPYGCCCCDSLFSPHDKPPAFIVLVPTTPDPDKVRAHALAVCLECSMQDEVWIIEQGVRREGLAVTPPRSGDKIH
jgi:hypothetical protein